ncbi:hypothetical protein, partial [Pseudomonas syringae group genomosp. 7]
REDGASTESDRPNVPEGCVLATDVISAAADGSDGAGHAAVVAAVRAELATTVLAPDASAALAVLDAAAGDDRADAALRVVTRDGDVYGT